MWKWLDRMTARKGNEQLDLYNYVENVEMDGYAAYYYTASVLLLP